MFAEKVNTSIASGVAGVFTAESHLLSFLGMNEAERGLRHFLLARNISRPRICFDFFCGSFGKDRGVTL